MRRTALTAAIAAGIAGALVLTSCGSSADGNPGRVVYWDTSGPNEHPVFRRLAERCASAGGYQVAVEQVAFDQARNNYKNAAQAGRGPDVFRAEVAWVAELARNGLIADLSGTDLAGDAGEHLQVAAESTRHDGRTYAVPQVSDALALFYNRKKLADAGVEPPRTWDEVRAIAPKLGGAKALFLNNDGYYSLPFVYGEGGDLLDTRARKITVNGEKAVRGLRTAKELIEAGAATTALDRTNSYANMQAAFTSGETAMVINGSWAVPDYLRGDAFRADPGNLGIAPVPGPTAGAGSSPVGGHNYVVRQGSKARDAAVRFVQCMSGTESQVTVARELGLLPTRRSAYDNADVHAQPTVSAFVPVLRQAHARPWIPEGGQLFDPLSVSYADLLAGKKDARAAADNVARAYKEQIVPNYDQG
ncbi:extracellular solute-binding protein [Streptoalloteichus hindustanus]|uniref:Carbohydrate ABC transporter substrate-binding protein, CUT1 family n=1 Tax=Streptoalloteichus hindustanus TaxID=2017 RepID=A0A1M4W4A3_STRHI|nr:extracellular solute-binding protein [Streptoalloteichus hindustanus]SHE76049.1 carbohydrate ABC transporter substrate-binding protein, CUT1 family [Streptoalloteichus hindustanus]